LASSGHLGRLCRKTIQEPIKNSIPYVRIQLDCVGTRIYDGHSGRIAPNECGKADQTQTEPIAFLKVVRPDLNTRTGRHIFRVRDECRVASLSLVLKRKSKSEWASPFRKFRCGQSLNRLTGCGFDSLQCLVAWQGLGL
jgi:hypothetical protein